MTEGQDQGQPLSHASSEASEAREGQAQGEPTEASAPEGYLPQETVNKIVGERAKEATERESRRIAEMFGYEDPSELSTVAEALSSFEEENTSEVEKRDKRIAKLEPVAKKAERYEAALMKHLEGQREGLPEHITALLDKMDAADQLDYIAEHGNALRPDSSANSRPPMVGRGSSPGSGAGQTRTTREAAEEDFNDLLRRRGLQAG